MTRYVQHRPRPDHTPAQGWREHSACPPGTVHPWGVDSYGCGLTANDVLELLASGGFPVPVPPDHTNADPADDPPGRH